MATRLVVFTMTELEAEWLMTAMRAAARLAAEQNMNEAEMQMIGLADRLAKAVAR